MRMLAGLLVSVFMAPLAAAQLPVKAPDKPVVEQASEKVIGEMWEAAHLEGQPAGFVHTVFKELRVNDRKIIEATTELDLTVARFGQTLQLHFVVGDHETPEGKVLAVVMKQNLSREQQQLVTGKVAGNELQLKIQVGNSPPIEKKTPWNEKVLGLFAQEYLFRGRELKPETRFDYYRYETVFAAVFRAHVEIKDHEEVTLLRGEKKRLLRTETSIEKVENVELPKTVVWVDSAGTPVKSQTELPGLGRLTTYRTTKEQAMVRGPARAVDVGISQLIRLNMAVPRPDQAREIVYRVRHKDLEEAETAFAKDERQLVKKLTADQLEIIARGPLKPTAQATPAKSEAPAKPKEDADKAKPELTAADYLKSNHFLRSDDERVMELSSKAVEEEKDPWEKAQRIARWVRINLRNKNFTEAFATADRVARSLEGDCTEHSVLAASMCRAAGVPARTAVGLVYVPQVRAMGYHMWMEVMIDGRWYALDPTINDGLVGPTYIKISDHHWNDVHSVTPLLPVVRLLGRVQIEIVSMRHEAELLRPPRAK